jgi:putative transposase
VDKVKELGYTVKDGCKAIGISRSWYYSVKKRNDKDEKNNKDREKGEDKENSEGSAKNSVNNGDTGKDKENNKGNGEETDEGNIIPDVSKDKAFINDKTFINKDNKDKALLDDIKRIKNKHPYWGYRRIWAWLYYREDKKVNRKRVYRIMKENKLLVTKVIHKAKRKQKRNKPRADKPLQYWGIDMTKFMVQDVGWVYLHIVLDWYTKKIVGYNMALRSRTTEWKESLQMAVNKEFPDGVRGKGLKLISDNGSQPTSLSFMKETKLLDIQQIFTSYNNPKGDADTERMMRTIKEEVIWLEEFDTFEEAKEKITKWIETDYNKQYVHSSLGYCSPEEFEKKYYEKEIGVSA